MTDAVEKKKAAHQKKKARHKWEEEMLHPHNNRQMNIIDDAVAGSAPHAQKGRFVLYVGRNAESCTFCKGSLMIIEYLASSDVPLAVRESTQIQDVTQLQRSGTPLPRWLIGTPMLVDTKTGETWKGTGAVHRARELHTMLIKAPIHGTSASSIGFPAGHVTPKETDKQKVTQREVEEYMKRRQEQEKAIATATHHSATSIAQRDP